MIEFEIKESIIESAKNRCNNVSVNSDKLNKYGSEKKRIFDGYLGEEIIREYLNIDNISDNYEYDLISNKNKRLEVKTITCSFKPKEDYLCTVNSHSLEYVHKQKADYYIFLRVLNTYKKAWILGWIECAEFFRIGSFVEKGTDFGKFNFTKANATVLEISKLNNFK